MANKELLQNAAEQYLVFVAEGKGNERETIEYFEDVFKAALAAPEAATDLEKQAAFGRELAAVFLPVMESMRPLVLNLERLKDAAKAVQ